jgi:hypothetical protein
MMLRIALILVALTCVIATRTSAAEPLRVGTFDIDATPPVGTMMAYDPVAAQGEMGLRARGIVLVGAGEPIVLCAVDWIGIANESHDAFREHLAAAAGSSPARVAVHTLHQHDAPESDFSAERLMNEAGLDPRQYEGHWQREVLARLASAVKASVAQASPVTHLGLGVADVEHVASNRRIFGPDGRVRAVRYTACKDAELQAEPEGTVDRQVSLVSFFNGDEPVAVLSYYATHPQSYYRTGIPSPDFPGIARFLRQSHVPEALHVHFNGAGGNIGAGKYNDGSPANRLVLAERLADGMRRAWEATERTPITGDDVGWTVEEVTLPVATHLSIAGLRQQLAARDPMFAARNEATKLAWLERSAAGHQIELACLRVGKARLVHMPGELFVEYQLAAKQMRPELFVAMAAYGDYAPFYIGTERAYAEGGYETEPRSSNVAPGVEGVLMPALERLLK